MRRALVTGATGFIGQHLVEQLVKEGARVRCLVHESDEVGALAGLDVEYVRGDVTQKASLLPAVQGVDEVYHLAGRTLALSVQDFYRINTDGTRHLAEACAARTSPPVLIFVSSLAAAGPSALDRPLVETDAPAPVSHYGRSKWAAEQVLRSWSGSIPITILRPPGVFGPRERYMLSLFRSVHKGWNVVPVRTPLRLSFVHVGDLARAMRLGAERGRRLSLGDENPEAFSRGIYYVASSECPTYVELGEMIGRILGRTSVITVRLPSAVGYVAAGVSKVVSEARGRPSLLNLDKMREASAGSWTCEAGRAGKELGFAPRMSLQEGLRETAHWYLANGWL